MGTISFLALLACPYAKTLPAQRHSLPCRRRNTKRTIQKMMQKLKEHPQPAVKEWKGYLIDGEIGQWDGATEEVYSPMGKVDADGRVDRVYLGSSPLLNESKGLEALEAARRAYANGRGMWPTATPGFRLRAMERFVAQMKEMREEVSSLIMWEIAKNRSTAYKEFDRTVQYIEDTLDEYKKMNRQGSHVTPKTGSFPKSGAAP